MDTLYYLNINLRGLYYNIFIYCIQLGNGLSGAVVNTMDLQVVGIG